MRAQIWALVFVCCGHKHLGNIDLHELNVKDSAYLIPGNKGSREAGV